MASSRVVAGPGDPWVWLEIDERSRMPRPGRPAIWRSDVAVASDCECQVAIRLGRNGEADAGSLEDLVALPIY